MQRTLHKTVVDTLLNQSAAGARTDFALIEGEHGKSLKGLIEEVIVFGRDIFKEDVGRFAAEFERDRSHVLAGILQDQPTGFGLAGKGNLGNARAGGQRLSSFKAKAIHDIEHAGRQ